MEKKRTYRFFNEGDNETLYEVETRRELRGDEIEMIIESLESETGLMVLWEEK